MKDFFKNSEEGKVFTVNGKTIIWNNEDNRGKTSIILQEGEIWIIPTNEGYTKVIFDTLKGYTDEYKVTDIMIPLDGYGSIPDIDIDAVENKVDDILTKLGY